MLCQLGELKYQKRRALDGLRTKIRTVGRLLKILNQTAMTDHDLSFYLNPKMFEEVAAAARILSKESPQAGLAVGHHIVKICGIKQVRGFTEDNETTRKEAENFLICYRSQWNAQVAAAARRKQRAEKINKNYILPSTSDLIKLRNFLVEKIEEKLVSGTADYQSWKELAATVMVRVVLFNKRRISEVEEKEATR